MQARPDIIAIFNGDFVMDFSVMKNKLRNIKAFIFDWDGVFNNGHKNLDGHSSFSEIDSMGINLLRFNNYLLQKKLPLAAIITGEKNEIAFNFAKRENFNNLYYKVKNKETALLHFCKQHHISPSEVMFMFDDVLDFSVAKLVGLRMMVNRKSNPLTVEYARQQRLVDYVTFYDGSNNAIREVSELCMLLSNNFQKVMELRMKNTAEYKTYIKTRNDVQTIPFTASGDDIVQP
jgi:3-deoxy-D-manno-octulosonate 8-phosphate phosphatase (KDO 8-P phosphatase)